jgi:hypothetical protein
VLDKDLVLRFMKKASKNLSHEFKVYVPSKRLPVNEQKRMLSKQLKDFLQIYQKDTEQIKIKQSSELEIEKVKNYKKLFNETALISLLNKSTEIQLEEIMSLYMKNSKDSSAFLGKLLRFSAFRTRKQLDLRIIKSTDGQSFDRDRSLRFSRFEFYFASHWETNHGP